MISGRLMKGQAPDKRGYRKSAVLERRLIRTSGCPSRRLRQKIGENKSIAFHNLADCNRYSGAEHWSRGRESMELSVFAARIDMARKSREQISVKVASGKHAIKLTRIDARQIRRQTPPQPCLPRAGACPCPTAGKRESSHTSRAAFPGRPERLRGRGHRK